MKRDINKDRIYLRFLRICISIKTVISIGCGFIDKKRIDMV